MLTTTTVYKLRFFLCIENSRNSSRCKVLGKMLPLSALALAALDDDDLRANREQVRDVFLPVIQRALPSCTSIPEWLADESFPLYSYMSRVCFAMSQLVRLDVCEQFLAAGVHKKFKQLRKMTERRTEKMDDSYIKSEIRSMRIFHTLGGRRLLAKMADPSYYAKLTRVDMYDSGYDFLRDPSHLAHMRALADLAATSFDFLQWDTYFTIREQDIDPHMEILRVDIAPSKRRRLF